VKKILVLAEHRDGELEEVTSELLGEARHLLKSNDGEVSALVIGSDAGKIGKVLTEQGAHKVFVADDPQLSHYDPEVWLATLIALCDQQEPDVILAPATSTGEDLAARLAMTKNWPLLSRSTRVKFQGDQIEAIRLLHGGKLQESVRGLGNETCIVTVTPGVLGVRAIEPSGEGSIIPIEIVFPKEVRVKVNGFVTANVDNLDLSEADVIVAAGRGMGNAQNVTLVRELATILGGAVGSTRVVVDLGWLGKETQVGQTGIRVKPRLYLACGISGATQHTIGMKDSATIIAINTDPTAPIFKIADLSLNADIGQLLPEIISRCRDGSEVEG
jgi:electron transfer flavoprotein alpha subunit